MLVLIVEEASSEWPKAMEALHTQGHKVLAFVRNPDSEMFYRHLRKCDGVITDLMMSDVGLCKYDVIQPAGLLVMIAAAALHKPIVVCTKLEKNDQMSAARHSDAYSWIYDGFVRRVNFQLACRGKKEGESWDDYRKYSRNFEEVNPPQPHIPIRFGWNEQKDWRESVALLEKLTSNETPKVLGFSEGRY